MFSTLPILLLIHPPRCHHQRSHRQENQGRSLQEFFILSGARFGRIRKSPKRQPSPQELEYKKELLQELESQWEKGLHIFYLPPYSPHLNIAETLWRIFKGKWIQPHHYGTKREFSVDNIKPTFLDNGTDCNVKYQKKQLLDANGNNLLPGEIHSSSSIPSCDAFFKISDSNTKSEQYSNGVIVADSYLTTHKHLPFTSACDESDDNNPLPSDIVKHLEQKYKMKASRSKLVCKIVNKYTYGFLQFNGEWKDAPKDEFNPDGRYCLAVDVLADGNNIYVNENAGYYDSEDEFGWNVDDGGEYSGSQLLAAFEGNDGLTLCYSHWAPESMKYGVFGLEKGKFKEKFFTSYHLSLDEE